MRFHRLVNLFYNTRHVIAPPSFEIASFTILTKSRCIVKMKAGFRIANIIEVNAVDVILTDKFSAQIRKIIGRARHTRVHYILIVRPPTEFRMLTYYRFSPQSLQYIQFTDRKSYHPRVQFHSSAVTFLNRKSQRVVSGASSGRSREDAVPRFDIGSISRCSAQAYLKQDGVNFRRLQLVQDAAQLFLLRERVVSFRPIQAQKCRKPNGAILPSVKVLRLR